MTRHLWQVRAEDRERDEQARTVTLYKSLGAKVWQTSQYRRANVSPGLPDLFVKFPARRLSFSHELKGKDGRVSLEQQEFADLCYACGDKHLVGGYDAAVTFLRAMGVVAPEWQP